MEQEKAGSGALGDLGAHIIDLARYVVGEVTEVMALTKTFIPERPLPNSTTLAPVTVDDAFAALVTFTNGAIGTLEASRFATGRKNHNCLEINGEKGSIRFDLQRLNELEVYWAEDEPKSTRGFHLVQVTEAEHPWLENWWPHGHIIGWEHTFVHEHAHLLDCIVNDKPVDPIGATFADGYQAARICDAILQSAESGERLELVG
jgi:predicted dehydrogenase